MVKKIKKTTIENEIREKIDVTKLSLNKLKAAFPFFIDLPLTPRQIRFVVAYSETNFKSREAYKIAGYKSTRPEVIDVNVCNLLKKKHVNEALKKYIEARLGDTRKTLDQKLIDTIYKRAFYDATMFVNDDGSFKGFDQIPDEWKCVVDGIEEKYYGKDAQKCSTHLKLADKDKALQHLVKYTNIIKDDSNFNLNISKEAEEKLKDIFNKGRK